MSNPKSFNRPVPRKFARASASPAPRWGRLLSALLCCVVLHASANADPNQLVVNPGFEDEPFTRGWTVTGEVESTSGLGGSTTAARLPWNHIATLSQEIAPAPADFTAEVLFQISRANEPQAFRWQLEADGTTVVDLRTAAGGELQLRSAKQWASLVSLDDDEPFVVPANQTVRLRVVGRDFGSPDASYDLEWSAPGQPSLSYAATAITDFASAAPPQGGIDRVTFVRDRTSDNSFTIDDATVVDVATAPAEATHELFIIEPKVVNISGVYPHLTLTNSNPESGIGAVVPWADRLWAVTYAPHSPRGSDDKLYEITPDLELIVRPESVGGTPANRFIHQATQQLIIGNHFIDKERNVRTLSQSVTPGRMTATAAHLTDPNRVYMYTMESGLYDVDARDLSVIVRYPDVQPRGDRFLHGYHGKGAYTGQGLLVVSNNGRAFDQDNPMGSAGVLATWDGTTVEDNDGVYTDNHLANPGSHGSDPVGPQPHFMAGWNQISLTQHCEVTGPGGIYGNPNPETDPIWSTGWDDKSILLHVMENQEWNLWRLPRGSYSHDGSHGWHVEWPRIRQLDPQDPDSIYLMHMHGLFFDFPKTFSAANFAGLRPISAFYKMPVDYAMFGGRIVIAKNDASRFANPLVRRPQSNFWFGDLDTIKQDWGAPAGVGAVWKTDAVTAGQVSDPFLVHGFPQRTLHLRNDGDAAIELSLEVSQGAPDWKEAKRWTVPANGYLPVILNDLDAQWVRIKSHGASSSLTAFFHMHSPYPHTAPSDEFDALADIDDNRPISDGVLRLMPDTSLSLEFASARTDASPHRYHRIGAEIKLTDVDNRSAEAELRRAARLQKDFGDDDASIYLLRGDTRYRLPRLHEGYGEPFPAGWARGLREVVTERSLLNAHGTFYEVPRDNSGGVPRMRPLATHGKRITDFAPWRGLFVLTGVLDAAPASKQVVKNEDGSAALWLGEVDDLWRMGEPRGYGGPWKNTEVAANAASDPFLMFGYDRKELTLKATEATTITVELDFLAENEWAAYKTFDLAAGESVTYLFPEGFHAHWVRVRSSNATTATAQFKYGPAN